MSLIDVINSSYSISWAYNVYTITVQTNPVQNIYVSGYNLALFASNRNPDVFLQGLLQAIIALNVGISQFDTDVTFKGLVDFDEDVTAESNLTVEGNLTVDGTSTLTGNVTTTNALSVGGDLTVTGTSTFTTDAIFETTPTFQSNITVDDTVNAETLS